MTAEQNILVTKADGTQEPFVLEKLENSLRKAGTAPAVRAKIIDKLLPELKPQMSTDEIYRRAFYLLKRHQKVIAARYSMKRAILEFGPSGFPFEEFIAHIYRARGFRTQTGIEVSGACVHHEVDVLAEKADEIIFIEAKFHNTLGFKSDVKVALYVHARFEDIEKTHPAGPAQKLSSVLVTNTSFTENAIQYARCVGLGLISWDHPKEGGNLHDLIALAGAFPITCLTTLSKKDKASLLVKNVVLCTDLAKDPDTLYQIGLPVGKADTVLEEVRLLCGSGTTVE